MTESSKWRGMTAAAGFLAGALLLGGCADPGLDETAGIKKIGQVQIKTMPADPRLAGMVPNRIRQAGTIVVATDPTYAPIQFRDTDNTTIIGVEPDLARALGQVLDLDIEMRGVPFDSIIPGLAATKFDLGMSSFTDTKEREKVVDFVTDFKAGTSLLVPAGNPEELLPSGPSLCGMRVAVMKGSYQADDDIPKRNQDCSQKISLQIYPDQNAVNLALTSGRSDAALADSPVADYSAATSHGRLEVPGEPYATAPYGIVVPKGSGGLATAIQEALKQIEEHGVYDEILRKWGVEAGAVTSFQINAAES